MGVSAKWKGSRWKHQVFRKFFKSKILISSKEMPYGRYKLFHFLLQIRYKNLALFWSVYCGVLLVFPLMLIQRNKYGTFQKYRLFAFGTNNICKRANGVRVFHAFKRKFLIQLAARVFLCCCCSNHVLTSHSFLSHETEKNCLLCIHVNIMVAKLLLEVVISIDDEIQLYISLTDRSVLFFIL